MIGRECRRFAVAVRHNMVIVMVVGFTSFRFEEQPGDEAQEQQGACVCMARKSDAADSRWAATDGKRAN